MCQAYEGEKRYVIRSELDDIHEQFRKHVEGEKPLTSEELKKLFIRKLMLQDAL